jgi:hypothetical protein
VRLAFSFKFVTKKGRWVKDAAPQCWFRRDLTNSVFDLRNRQGLTYPGTGNFQIRIDNELTLVTAVSGTTWTVTRGIESTGAASHLNGVAVNHFMTAGGLAQIFSEAGGTASITWAGTWAIGANYSLNSAVSYVGSSYLSLSASNIGNQPDISPTYWAVLATSGASDASLSVTDNTVNNVSTSAHGFTPKAPNDGTKYFDGTGL